MNNKKTIYGIIFILICLVAIGYAAIVSNISITGTVKMKANTFDVHFENVSVTSGSVAINTTAGDSAATIEPTNRTRIDYSVTLEKPGDFYEFTVKVVNGGTIDAMINTVTSKMNNVVINNNLPNYLEYNVTYEDGIEIEPYHELNATQVETYKVRVAYRTDIDPSDLPTTPSTLNFSFSVNYIQKDSNAITRPVLTFADGSWSQIASVANMANPCNGPFSVGDTKEIDMGTFGTHTLRIANCSKPAECSTAGFSQTACGVVIEFADLTTNHNMNSSNTNVGGWPASAMRAYVNTDIYDALPSELRSVIVPTKVISGHGSTSGETNFESTDKLYLLSPHEVWEDDDGNANSGPDYYDTAYSNTRQLDYYKNLGVTASNYSGARKKDGNYNLVWWLRSAISSTKKVFGAVGGSGIYSNYDAVSTYNVSPAFRIG